MYIPHAKGRFIDKTSVQNKAISNRIKIKVCVYSDLRSARHPIVL